MSFYYAAVLPSIMVVKEKKCRVPFQDLPVQ